MMNETDANLALLNPSESREFQAFLSQLDRLDAFDVSPANEWSAYVPTLDTTPNSNDGKEELTRATKSLMALDPPRYPPTLNQYHQQTILSGRIPSPYTPNPHFLNNNNHPTTVLLQPAPASSYPRSSGSSHDAKSGPSSSSRASAHQSKKRTSPPDDQHRDSDSSGSKNKRQRRPSSPSDSLHPPSHSSSSSTSLSTLSTITPSPQPRSKSTNTNSNTKPSSASPTSPTIDCAPVTHPTPTRSGSTSSGNPNKPTLLSTSQKKANHIQSEQKRRANIRRGYEALCEVVPALREAIRAEEEAALSASLSYSHSSGSGGGNAGGVKRRGKGKMLGDDGEKMDGRAGPRSESVVLQKTIDHIREMVHHRNSLLERLHHARRILPPSHPALTPLPTPVRPHPLTLQSPNVPVWERIWDGGTGLPIPGMGLPKRGVGSGVGGLGGKLGGKGDEGGGGGDGEDEYDDDGDSDEDM